MGRSVLSPLYNNSGKNLGSSSYKAPLYQRMHTKTTLLREIGLKRPRAPKSLSTKPNILKSRHARLRNIELVTLGFLFTQKGQIRA